MKLQRALHPNFFKRLQHMVFLGTLVRNDAEERSFTVQCLSPVPRALLEVLSVAGEDLQFTGTHSFKQNEKLLRQFPIPKAALFLFRLRYTNRYVSVELLAGKEGEPAASYRLIPVPQLSAGQTRESFERKLCKGYISFLLPKYASDFGMPELLYCRGRLYGSLSLKSTVSSVTYREQRRSVLYDDFSEWTKHAAWNVDDLLYIVEAGQYDVLCKRMEEKARKLVLVETQPRAKEKPAGGQEAAFLECVRQKARIDQLYIEDSDMMNFHTCMKAGTLTIVGGMPGIGKSRFVKLYGEALGLRYGKELHWIPVSPSFQEPQDVLGYSHPDGTYQESETGLVSLLLEAQLHPEKLYMVVFDEMNISHIEYWFTPFLSVLELPPDERLLTLHALGNELAVPEQIRVGRNVLFVGTVNFDETTKELSDRLLDRANMVTLQKQSFREALAGPAVEHAAAPSEVTAAAFQAWQQDSGLHALTEEEIELLDALDESLRNHDATKGVSFRTAAAIAAYISNIPRDADGNSFMSREEAFDLQIRQRILSKVRGMEHVVTPLLQDGGKRGRSLAELLQSPLAQEVSTFAHSLQLLKQKLKEAELYGYAK